jgi:energy-converting hydrogenase Eha subunit B
MVLGSVNCDPLSVPVSTAGSLKSAQLAGGTQFPLLAAVSTVIFNYVPASIGYTGVLTFMTILVSVLIVSDSRVTVLLLNCAFTTLCPF